MTDPELRDLAIESFAREARAKFDAGMREHNPDGTKGLCKMSIEQLVACAKEECIDQWMYLTAIEHAADKQEERIKALSEDLFFAELAFQEDPEETKTDNQN